MQAGRTLILVGTVGSLLVARTAGAQLVDLDDPELKFGKLAISARAGYRKTSFGQRDWIGAVSLVVPLERLGMPARRAAFSEPAGSAPEIPEQPRTREIEIVVTPELARGAVRAALRASGYGSSLRRLDGLASRAQSSALLPELRLRGARTVDESMRLAPTTTDPYRYTQAGGTSVTFEARLTWKLDRLVFADEELEVERLRGQRASAARALTREVLHTLVVWQRAQIRAADPELLPAERLDATLDALESKAALDVLTNGWFSWWLRRLAKASETR